MYHYGTHVAHDGEMPAMPTLSQVMRKAWERYNRTKWSKSEAFDRKRFAECLKEAWSILRGPDTIVHMNEKEQRELAR